MLILGSGIRLAKGVVMLISPKILVCSDFSLYSDLAIKAADKIRQMTNGTLEVIHVSEYSVMWDWMPPSYLEGGQQLDLLNTLRKKLELQLEKNGISAISRIDLGLASAVILNEIEEKNYDLIVMGHKGREGRFRLGTLAEKIISNSKKPILIVKDEFFLKKIAGLVDPLHIDNDIINWTQKFSELFNISGLIVSLFPDISSKYIGLGKLGFSTKALELNEATKKEIAENIQKKIAEKISATKSMRIKTETTGEKKLSYHLCEILNREDVQLVVMKKHQSEFIEKILIGSETRRMLEIFDKNLLILPYH